MGKPLLFSEGAFCFFLNSFRRFSVTDAAMEHFKGIYLITPFNYYEMTVELTKYIMVR
ncbi:hypothetical protein [Desulfosporosinus sp. Sb-LF]|uniref:hypothetical protein n=1 Tax=Desulfosporosinus sp. Sb-LF TaxID=2560027 RepID=UPI001305326C|nr:hypothetical protein [Desulfosporosinus sp. Sb-LF]